MLNKCNCTHEYQRQSALQRVFVKVQISLWKALFVQKITFVYSLLNDIYCYFVYP